jgi:ribose transport system ATP-binding protein
MADAAAAKRASDQAVQPEDGVLALDVPEVTKTFPGTLALSGVSLQIRRGEIHAVMGQNGSGKSTLIKILAGFHRPDTHTEARCAGVSVHLGDSTSARSAGLRFVHQDLGLVSDMSALDNLALGAGYATSGGVRIKWREQRAAATSIIHALGYSFDVRTPVEQLSAVERSQLAIARALRGLEEVRVLVLDEPTATMPQHDVQRLHAVVRRVRDMGIGILYVSHHIDEVLELADRVTVLRDGKRVGTYRVAELDPRRLVEAMTGGVVDETDAGAHRSNRPEALAELRSVSGRVVAELDLTMHAGEVVGVAGLTGSGRDELCGLIFGGRPRLGEVLIEGTVLPPSRPDLAVAAGMGYVPAERHVDGLVLSMSVKENLTLADLRNYRKLVRLRRAAERKDTLDWVAKLKIRTPGLDTDAENLSGGNQQKVVMGKWLRLRPRVLLLDEPTQGVDVAAKAELHALVDQAAAEGAAVMVCSSDEHELERLCDRVVVLRRGRVVSEFHRPQISAARLAAECLSERSTKEEKVS